MNFRAIVAEPTNGSVLMVRISEVSTSQDANQLIAGGDAFIVHLLLLFRRGFKMLMNLFCDELAPSFFILRYTFCC